ncbi:hypothetical protein P43SY_001611 [Pythium insidiosum]|uniref:HTH psq-type domain-containing protein n=1 Tax=Pythium insidiosum TaxID=114742 RepID=A0AAD5M7P6_PYTIN|nr:hypothetical protein P43SY_001611 [Pythium insidiosum]
MTTLSLPLPSFQNFVQRTKSPVQSVRLPERFDLEGGEKMLYMALQPALPMDVDDHFSSASSDCGSTSTSDVSSEDSMAANLQELMASLRPPVHAHAHAPARRPERRRAAVQTAATRRHTCRSKKKYLTELQRYEIVRRALAGERQAALAREFGVTRAAVCYLLKHHEEILQRVSALQEHFEEVRGR